MEPNDSSGKIREILGDPKETLSRQHENLGVHRHPTTPQTTQRSDRELFARTNAAAHRQPPSRAAHSDRSSERRPPHPSSGSDASRRHRDDVSHAERSRQAHRSSSIGRQVTSHSQEHAPRSRSSVAPDMSHSQPLPARTPDVSSSHAQAHHQRSSSHHTSRHSQHERSVSDGRRNAGAARLLPLKVSIVAWSEMDHTFLSVLCSVACNQWKLCNYL